MLEILRKIGCKVTFEEGVVTVDSSTINSTEVPEDLAIEMRVFNYFFRSHFIKV